MEYLKQFPNKDGYFGEYGGSFVPDILQKEMDKITAIKSQRGSGGNFYATLKYRVGITFAKTIISEVADNNIPYQDAFRLLHVKNTDKLIALSQEVGLPIL